MFIFCINRVLARAGWLADCAKEDKRNGYVFLFAPMVASDRISVHVKQNMVLLVPTPWIRIWICMRVIVWWWWWWWCLVVWHPATGNANCVLSSPISTFYNC